MCCDCMAVEGATVSLRACHGSRGAQEWLYNKVVVVAGGWWLYNEVVVVVGGWWLVVMVL